MKACKNSSPLTVCVYFFSSSSHFRCYYHFYCYRCRHNCYCCCTFFFVHKNVPNLVRNVDNKIHIVISVAPEFVDVFCIYIVAAIVVIIVIHSAQLRCDRNVNYSVTLAFVRRLSSRITVNYSIPWHIVRSFVRTR